MKRVIENSQGQHDGLTKGHRGSVLLVVLVVVVLLALGAYTFSETMISERQATAMYGRKLETRMLADSGVDFVAALLAERSISGQESLYHNSRFQDVLVVPSDRQRSQGRFSVVAPREHDAKFRAIRFGLIDESGKLNLNVLANRIEDDLLDENQARAILTVLPGMTPDTADAILDWLDADETTRQFGAESEFYSRFDPPYRAKNGPLDSLDELRMLRGVSADLLFGEDANRNGLLDDNENDGDESPPADNADGVLNRGWLGFLTLDSREGNRRRDGRPKINVNQRSLGKLFEQISREFGDDIADFIVTFRKGNDDAPPQNDPAEDIGRQRIGSLYDLIGAELKTVETGATHRSPFSTDPVLMRKYLPAVLDAMSTHGESYIAGRINVNVAPREVLLAVPGMSVRLADIIIAAQANASTGEAFAADAARQTTAWLLLEGHTDLATMRQLDRYITARGDVYRTQVIGYFDGGATVTRLETVIDATYQIPRVISLEDLTPLGPGFSRWQFSRHEGK